MDWAGVAERFRFTDESTEFDECLIKGSGVLVLAKVLSDIEEGFGGRGYGDRGFKGVVAGEESFDITVESWVIQIKSDT